MKLAGIPQKLWRIEDFSSDSVVLRLVSAHSVGLFLTYSEGDGVKVDAVNFSVTVVSLVFMRLRLYAVNARNVPWKERATYIWVSFL